MEPERLAYPLSPDSVVIEIGGYHGEFTEAISSKFGCRVFVFEPVRQFYDDLQRLRSDKVRIFNYGIGATDRRERISVRNDSSSLYRESTEGKYQEVEIRAMKGAMEESSIDRVDLLACNCEGGEFEILPHLIEEGLIGRFRDIMVQFHDFVPGSADRRQQIRQRLTETHHLTYDHPFIWENWRLKQ